MLQYQWVAIWTPRGLLLGQLSEKSDDESGPG